MFSGAYFSQNQTNVIVESNDSYQAWIKKTVKKVPVNGLNRAGLLYEKRLEKGDKGWATIHHLLRQLLMILVTLIHPMMVRPIYDNN